MILNCGRLCSSRNGAVNSIRFKGTECGEKKIPCKKLFRFLSDFFSFDFDVLTFLDSGHEQIPVGCGGISNANNV